MAASMMPPRPERAFWGSIPIACGLPPPSDQALALPPLQGKVEQISEHVQAVKEMLDDPSMYAEPQHEKEFKKIVQAQIARKISELESLSPEEIHKTEERLKRDRQDAATYKERISGRAPPPEGSAAHVVSEDEAVRLHFGHEAEFQEGDREAVLAEVQQDGMALEYASEALRNDRDVVLAAVRQKGGALQFASEALRNDREVVLAAVQQKVWAFLFASEALRNDRDFVLAAVQQDGMALEYASEAMKSDREVILAAIRQNPGARAFAAI